MSPKLVTYTKNVFIPVTNMCRNNCAYCGFRRDIGSGEDYLTPPAEAKALIAKAAGMGCVEALFTYGDAPQDPRFSRQLQEIGYPSLTAYVRDLSLYAIDAGMLPHTNGGVLSEADLRELADLNASMGLMLETTVKHLPAHSLSPMKDPEVRIRFIEEAGKLRMPFTTGILIGIGETWQDRKESLEIIRDIHRAIRPHPGGHRPELRPEAPHPHGRGSSRPTPADMMRVIRMAREILPGGYLPPGAAQPDGSHLNEFLEAGAEDIGGISPVTRGLHQSGVRVAVAGRARRQRG